MKALVADHYGAPRTLRLLEVPKPVPGAREILIRVAATTVNRTDTCTLRAHPFFARLMTGLIRPKFDVFGMEFAGVIERLGASAGRFREGDLVFGLSPDRFGAHAEYLVVPEDGAVALIPEALTPTEAVVCEGAWYAQGSVGALRPGQRVLIYGASGAIGTAAVQLAKARGAEVTAIVGPRHLDLARKLGADRVVDYTTGAAAAIDTPFDLVIDAVGKTSYFAWRHLLKPGGAYKATDLGPGWSNIWLGLWSQVTGSGRVSVPFPADAPGFVAHLRGLMAAGRFRGVFDRSYPFDRIAEAYAYVESGEKTGIVVLDMAPHAKAEIFFAPPH